jgi:hypothetical protein
VRDVHRLIGELAEAMEAAGMTREAAQGFRDDLTESVIARMNPYLRALAAERIAHQGWQAMVEALGCSRRNAYYLAAKGRAIKRMADCTEA